MHVLSVSSLKGGVGKTTVTLGLASAAFARGVRTLVVDLDPQSDVSTGMDIQVAGRLNVADVLANPKEKVVRQAITSSGWAKVHPGTIDVLIGSPSAINFDGPHPSVRDVWKLEEALATIEADYDLVLIDCPPGDETLQTAAVAAASWALVPTKTDASSLKGLYAVAKRLESVLDINPDLDLLGVVLAGVSTSATTVKKRARTAISEAFDDDAVVFEAAVRHSEATAEATRARGLLVHELDNVVRTGPKWYEIRRGEAKPQSLAPQSSSSVADDLMAVAQELVQRVTAAESEAETA